MPRAPLPCLGTDVLAVVSLPLRTAKLAGGLIVGLEQLLLVNAIEQVVARVELFSHGKSVIPVWSVRFAHSFEEIRQSAKVGLQLRS